MANCATCSGIIYKCDECGKVGCQGRTGPGNSQECPNAAFHSGFMDEGKCVSCSGMFKSET